MPKLQFVLDAQGCSFDSEIVGKVYGRLTATGRITPEHKGIRKAEVLCDCGNLTWKRYNSLITSGTRSCGCLNIEQATQKCFIHGASRTRLYSIYHNMLCRCRAKSGNAHKYYGSRGISVCDEWANSFEVFAAWAMVSGYTDLLSLDRKENEIGYCPSNCRWVTHAGQMRNTRRCVHVAAFGETKTVAEWTRDARCSVGEHTLHSRLRAGTDPETAISTPPTPRSARRRKSHSAATGLTPLIGFYAPG